jgi:hypothetical protein
MARTLQLSLLLSIIALGLTGCDAVGDDGFSIPLTGIGWVIDDWQSENQRRDIEGVLNMRINVSPDSTLFVVSGNCGRTGRFVGTRPGRFRLEFKPGSDIDCGSELANTHMAALQGAEEAFIKRDRLYIPVTYGSGGDRFAERLVYRPTAN